MRIEDLIASQLTDATDHAEKVRVALEAPAPLPGLIYAYVCACGTVSLNPLERGHWLGYPNAYGLPRCPFEQEAQRVAYARWACEGCGETDAALRYDNGAACTACVMRSFAESG